MWTLSSESERGCAPANRTGVPNSAPWQIRHPLVLVDLGVGVGEGLGLGVGLGLGNQVAISMRGCIIWQGCRFRHNTCPRVRLKAVVWVETCAHSRINIFYLVPLPPTTFMLCHAPARKNKNKSNLYIFFYVHRKCSWHGFVTSPKLHNIHPSINAPDKIFVI